jgi:hypothetical protein
VAHVLDGKTYKQIVQKHNIAKGTLLSHTRCKERGSTIHRSRFRLGEDLTR